jgi:acyl carrier protein
MVAADGGEDIPGISEIRQYLSRTLPDYMIPSYVMQLETIPLTPNGKVNRKALPQPIAASVEAYAAPSNQVEEQLVEIWSQLLDVETIGVNDNFFDLGGNSARLIRLADILNKHFSVEVKIVDLFHFNTIGQLAEHLSGSTDLDINTAADIDDEEIESFSL